MKFKILLVIPARFNSTRLPGKPLKKIGNKTLIQRVYERAKKVNCAKIIVATDDKRIFKHCQMNKIKCVMTRKIIQQAQTEFLKFQKNIIIIGF